MRTFFDMWSAAISIVIVLYSVHVFLAMHARLSEIRDRARAEATLRPFVKSRRSRRDRESRVTAD